MPHLFINNITEKAKDEQQKIPATQTSDKAPSYPQNRKMLQLTQKTSWFKDAHIHQENTWVASQNMELGLQQQMTKLSLNDRCLTPIRTVETQEMSGTKKRRKCHHQAWVMGTPQWQFPKNSLAVSTSHVHHHMTQRSEIVKQEPV